MGMVRISVAQRAAVIQLRKENFMILGFDIEADNLLTDATQMWVLCAKIFGTDKRYKFYADDTSWQQLFSKAKLVVAHNGLGYDLPLLKKLYDYELPSNVKVADTLLMSQILDYRRFGYQGHSLEQWGTFLEFPKMDFRQTCVELGYITEKSPKGEEFREYCPEMDEYCETDVELLERVFNVLSEEYEKLIAKAPNIKTYMRAEHAVAKWSGRAELNGWPFDIKKAIELRDELRVKVDVITSKLEGQLGTKCVIVDKIPHSKDLEVKAETKYPVWVNSGHYAKRTAEWLNVPTEEGLYDDPICEGGYCRIEFQPLQLSSSSDVKIFLFRQGWQPTEYNWKIDPDNYRNKIRMAPKITEDSLILLGPEGELYKEYVMMVSRYGIVKGWIEKYRNGSLHGGCMVVGTPSMRSRHNIIANVPSGEKEDDGTPTSPYGEEMRRLFMSKPGYTLVGCDSSGNQARGLAHYLGNEEYIKILLHEDIHVYNMHKINDVLEGMGRGRPCTRPQAKRILYAFLFGAGGGKLWLYIFGTIDDRNGAKLKNGFIAAVPGFKNLVDKLTKIYGSTKKRGFGYIPSLAGNRIYIDSPHKLLVYLLQACEKITCSTALMLAVQKLEEEDIEYYPLIMYHDEFDFMVKDEDAPRAKEIGVWSFKEGPKRYNVNIMDGSGAIGKTWYDIH